MWVAEVNAVLAKCPSNRLVFFTGGDPNVGMYLKKHEDAICAENDDVVRILARKGWLIDETITFPGNVEAVCI